MRLPNLMKPKEVLVDLVQQVDKIFYNGGIFLDILYRKTSCGLVETSFWMDIKQKARMVFANG